MTRTSTQNRSRRTTTVVVIVIVLVVAVAATLFYRSARQFGRQYAAFATAEKAYEDAAYKPSLQSNPTRQDVNMLLAQVLQLAMTPAERLDKAKQGIAHLNEIEGEIDAIKTAGDVVEPLLERLDKTTGSPANIRNREKTKEIVSLAKENKRIISDISGLSYRADYYTDEVFERIIDDQGEMTDEHKTHLNDLIPQLEEQYNRRQNLYNDLKKNSDQINEIAAGLGYTTP